MTYEELVARDKALSDAIQITHGCGFHAAQYGRDRLYSARTHLMRQQAEVAKELNSYFAAEVA